MKNIKISIVVPVYNIENYIKDCLESLVNQTIKDIEIICIDDCSTDNSYFILKEYEELYPNIIKIYKTKENIKQGGARNLGISKSSGEYIAFVDGDDWVDIKMYEKLYNTAIKQNADVVDCDYYEANSTSSYFAKRVESNKNSQIGNIDTDKKRSLILYSGRIFTKIIRRKIFIENEIRYPENVFYEDNQLAPILMMYVKSIAKVNEALYYYRVSNISTTRRINDYIFFDRLITSENLLNEFKRRGFYNKYKNEIEFRVTELFFINSILGSIFNFDPPPKNKIREIKKRIKVLIPNYKLNIYYRKNISYKKKIILILSNVCPNLLRILLDR